MLPYCLERGLYLFAVYLLCIIPSEAKRINITVEGLYDTDLSPDGAVIGERFYAAPESLPESLYQIHVKISTTTLDASIHEWRAEDLLTSNVTVEEKKEPERIRSRRSTDGNFTPWTKFSCCNKVTKTQTRERKNSRELTIETRYCNWNFCTECKDTWKDCKKLKDFGACHGNSDYQSYMATNCMQTCQLCVRGPAPSSKPPTLPTTTTKKPSVRTTTKPKTKTPRVNRRGPGSKRSEGKRSDSLVRVGVFSAYYRGNLHYQYTMVDSTPKARYPVKWQSANVNNKDDISDFFLSSKRSKQYNDAIYFCKSRFGTMEKYLVRQTPCNGGWSSAFTLYGTVQPNALSQPLKVAATGRNPWMSRIYRSKSCCGYQTKTWTFHALKYPEPQTVQPSPASNIQLPPVQLNDVEKSCLDQHNFFRAFHGAPPLRWDPELAKSASLWANYLNGATESTPHVLNPKYQKTPQWPHSLRGSKYRKERSGENIAWELSAEMGSADEFVMHWYAEIFDYDRNNIFAKTKNRPIGHFTQLVWKETRSLGCALRKKKIQYQGREYEVGYVVAQYSPGGNVHSGSHDRTNRFYQHNVNQLMTGTCRSPQHCGMHDKNGCLGFDPSFTCGCQKVKGLSTPKCVGKKGGCVVKCNAANPNDWKPWISACKGKTMCRCDPDRGAICR